MKIAFLAPEFYNAWGGVGTYSIELIKNLSESSDVEVHVITPNIDDIERKKRISSIFGDNVLIHTLSNANDTFIYNIKFQSAVFNGFNKLLKKYNFDIVHSANLVHMPDIFLKFKKHKIPSLVTVHTTINGQVSGYLKGGKNFLKMAPSEKLSLLAYPLIKFFEWYYLKNTRNLITVSNKFQAMLMENGYSSRIRVIHNGIDTNHFNFYKVKEEDCKKKFPFLKDVNKPIIMFAGRIINQKGIEVLMKAIDVLQKKGIKFYCIIAGKGDYGRLHQLMLEYGINKANVKYAGYVENADLVYLYKLSDIFVLPSYYENFPMSLLEAMSLKCCCISTDVGAVSEIIENTKNGLLIGQGDYKRLADSIEYLLDNRKKMLKMAENGRKKVLMNFRSDIMAKKTMGFYHEILENGN